MAMQCLSKGSQQLSMSLTNNGGLQGFLTIVYSENIHARRESLWKELHQIAIQIKDSPWLVAGDLTLQDSQLRRWVVRHSNWASYHHSMTVYHNVTSLI